MRWYRGRNGHVNVFRDLTEAWWHCQTTLSIRSSVPLDLLTLRTPDHYLPLLATIDVLTDTNT